LKNLKKNITIGNIILKNFINLSEQEKEIVRNWRNADTVRSWSLTGHIISINEHHDFIEKLKEDNHNFYWLVKNADKYLGVIDLIQVDFNNKNAYLGIYSNPYLKGAGNLLQECLIKVTFDMACLHTLKLEVIEDNEKALKLFTRFGFEKEGELKDFVFKNGKYKNVIIMGIINKNGSKN
jgi:UDP-4-amino-4,6-dideoxy-N-acetyl-beta-L-altrosamine N-acetyltransferase